MTQFLSGYKIDQAHNKFPTSTEADVTSSYLWKFASNRITV